jgi:predicted DNA-binding ArsR family transcriptional regulator
MDQPVTTEACEKRRCEIRKWVKEEIRDVMATVNSNHDSLSDWMIRIEQKMEENNRRISDKIDQNTRMQVILILAIALGGIGVRMGWI